MLFPPKFSNIFHPNFFLVSLHLNRHTEVLTYEYRILWTFDVLYLAECAFPIDLNCVDFVNHYFNGFFLRHLYSEMTIM